MNLNIKKLKSHIEDTFSLINNDNLIDNLFKLKSKILKIKNKKKKILIIGNGGSAATASHVSVDLTKNSKVETINFNEADFLTCFANDFGFEHMFEKALEYYCEKGDLVIILSVSGNSINLVNAAKYCIRKKIDLVTFSGNTKKNKILTLNKKNLNFFINSKAYNQVEIIHHFFLLTLVDLIIGKFKYGTNI